MKRLADFLEIEGPVKIYIEELLQKYNLINEESRVVTHSDVIGLMKGDKNIEPFTNKHVIQAGLFGLEVHEDGTATLLTLSEGK